MQVVNLTQCSPEWHAHRRNHFNASDAPAMMGVSPYKTRDQLLHEMATGLTKEVDAATQKRFDDGHKFEALARPLAEKIIEEDLSPIVGTEGKLSSSFDGITFGGEVVFEHKTLNFQIASSFDNSGEGDDLPIIYRMQMEQQLLVSGAEKCLFMASNWIKVDHVTEHYVTLDENGKVLPPLSSGVVEYYELDEKHHCWYYPDLKLREKIIAGWEQFEKDLAAYVPPVQVEKVEAKAVEALPVPSVVVKGELVSCNLKEITPHFDAYLAGINTTLATDQDFADAEVEAKNCREMAKKLDTVTEAIISQMGDINTAIGILGDYSQKLNKMGLQLEKAVKEQKESVKTAAIMKAKQAYSDHLNELQKDCVVMLHLVVTAPDFAGAIKGVKTIASMQSRINDALAAGKAELSVTHQNIIAKTELIKSSIEGYAHLINISDLATRDIDFIKLHIQSVKDREDARKAAHEAAIVAKAEAEARAKVLAEQAAAAQAAKVAEAKPEVVEESIPAKEVVTKPQSTALRTQPTANQIVELVATHYSVSKAEAHKWLCETDFAGMMKAAA